MARRWRASVQTGTRIDTKRQRHRSGRSAQDTETFALRSLGSTPVERHEIEALRTPFRGHDRSGDLERVGRSQRVCLDQSPGVAPDRLER
jgi:hypothetical protein